MVNKIIKKIIHEDHNFMKCSLVRRSWLYEMFIGMKIMTLLVSSHMHQTNNFNLVLFFSRKKKTFTYWTKWYTVTMLERYCIVGKRRTIQFCITMDDVVNCYLLVKCLVNCANNLWNPHPKSEDQVKYSWNTKNNSKEKFAYFLTMTCYLFLQHLWSLH